MLALERKQKIIERLRLDRKVYVGKLSRDLDVTEETIRRDLKEIEKQGIARTVRSLVTVGQIASKDSTP